VQLHGGHPVPSAPPRNDRDLSGSHAGRLPGGSQSVLITPQNLALFPARRHASSLPRRPAGPNDPLGATVRTPIPSLLPGLHVFSPLDGRGLALALGTRGNSRGSEWGLGPLRIGSTTADVSAIHWFAASRLRRRRHRHRRRSARADERRSAATPARRSHLESRTSEQPAPNPGTSCRGALGKVRRPRERSPGESDRDRSGR
jgi:hypothetical protein